MAVYGHLGIKGLKYNSSLLFYCVVKLKSVFCKVYVKHFVRSKNVSHSDAPRLLEVAMMYLSKPKCFAGIRNEAVVNGALHINFTPTSFPRSLIFLPPPGSGKMRDPGNEVDFTHLEF